MCTTFIVAPVIAWAIVYSPLLRQAILSAVILFLLIAFLLVNAASAHRLTGHDYRSTPHWCTWSAASVCAKWRARGGALRGMRPRAA
jgi:hypothetical protein